MLVRKPDWQTQLHQFLQRGMYQRFAYGKLDCCLFVADAVYAMTDRDIAVQFRGKYRSRKEALDLCKSYSGVRSIRALALKAFADFKEVPVNMAQRGDIVLVKRPHDWSLGIVDLTGREILAASADGYVRLALNSCVRAWRV